LQCSAEIHRTDTQRQEICKAGKCTTAQPGEECSLAAFSIGESTNEWPAAQRHDGKCSDDKSYGAIGFTEVNVNMGRKAGQDRAESKESEKGRCNQAPEAPTK
jgi:hypothetical protein